MDITWDYLVSEEPALADLEEELRELKKPDAIFCSQEVWNGIGKWQGIKPRLAQLVGSEAGKESLRNDEAYDLAYQYLAGILMPCRNCQCLCTSIP